MSNRIPLPAGFSDTTEITIWKALICKYMCKKNKDDFHKAEFLQAVMNDEIQQVYALDKGEMKKAVNDDDHHYSILIRQCLEWVVKNDLLDIGHQKTNRLRVLCPEILKYDMPSIEVLVKGIKDAESEIQNNQDLPQIVSLLRRLEDGTEINVEEAIHDINKDTLTKLNQLGVINVSLNNQIAISHLGQKMLLLRR